MTIEYTQLSARAQSPVPATPFHEWVLDDGTRWTEFYRTECGYLLRFPDVADFEISVDAREVRCHPTVDVDPETVEHRYLHQVRPLVMSKRGGLVFHASAVEIDGRAVAFAAPSGRGKSTLAAAFSTQGFRFLTDDGLILEPTAGGFQALPSYPFLRLWSDSHTSIIDPRRRRAAPDALNGFKARVQAGSHVPFCPIPRLLHRVYFLEDGGAPSFTCTRLDASAAIVAWVEHSFLLDPCEPGLLATHFEHVSALASLPLSYRLNYPRCFDELPQVRHRIIEHLRHEE